ncbi:MAG: hypothetical protein MUO94_07225 [Thermoplasmata archaeon]|nr:hypothetical protein [Thermoplasmata archaeon]
MGMTEDGDVPRIVATVIYKMPVLAVRVGVRYLSMRTHARRASRELRRSMVSEGMPEDLAKQLSDDYAMDLSIGTLMKGFAKDS